MNESQSSFPPPHNPSPGTASSGTEAVKTIPRPGKEGGATSIYVTDYRRIDNPPRFPESEGVGRVKDLAPLFIILAAVVVLFPLWMREKPDHSPNDASRWNTIFYLLEYGRMDWMPDWEPMEWHGGRGKPLEEYPENVRGNAIQVGEKYYTVYDHRFWNIAPFMSIDMIKVGEKYYSSKPPLLTWMIYGVTWTIQQASGMLREEPWTFRTLDGARSLMRTTVTVMQVVPFLFCVWLLACEVRRMSDSVFVRNFTIASAALGTYLTPWLIPLNNHVPAACCVIIAVYAGMRIWYDKSTNPIWYLLAGTFGALAFCCELPALALFALVFIAMIVRSRVKTLVFGLIPAMVIAGLYLYTTHQVTGSWHPIPSYNNTEGSFYDYEGSYWFPNTYNPGGRQGMDALEEDKPIYLMHLLVGHHGFFLLTPIFLISLLGIIANLVRRDDKARPHLALGTLVITVAVVGFYTWTTNNYGGVAQGARWLFWLIPLWLLMLPAGLHVLGKVKVGRAVCYLLLAVSLFSAWWALPQVTDMVKRPPEKHEVHRPFSDSWAHIMFRKDWMPDTLEIEY